MDQKNFPSYKKVKVRDLIPYIGNARTHSPEQVEQIAASITEFGFINPIITDGSSGIIAGHGRLLAAELLEMTVVPTIDVAWLTDAQKKAYILADNKLPENAGWDRDLLAIELTDLKAMDFDLSLTGFSDWELNDLLDSGAQSGSGGGGGGSTEGNLFDRFLVPPFSTLDSRAGYWQERKNHWKALGIQSELGRAGKLTYQIGDTATWNAKKKGEKHSSTPQHGPKVTKAADGTLVYEEGKGTSIFDPVVCEIAYSWFTKAADTILDPFAGGSVRGIVASRLGRAYTGIELRPEQVAANRSQLDICSGYPSPIWITGDSQHVDTLAPGKYDFLFTCPPYADLEIYSDDPADISNMKYPDFLVIYRHIIQKSLAQLENDRFAMIVVGEVRDKKGIYRNLVADTISAFIDAGASYYNECILMTQVGSVAIRAGKAFSASRKIGKTHQNILIFVKGSPTAAAKRLGKVDVLIPDEETHPDAEFDLG